MEMDGVVDWWIYRRLGVYPHEIQQISTQMGNYNKMGRNIPSRRSGRATGLAIAKATREIRVMSVNCMMAIYSDKERGIGRESRSSGDKSKNE